MQKKWRFWPAVAVCAALLSACGGGDSTSSTGSDSGVPLSASYDVTGWASQGAGTTGGTGAPATNIYVVHNRAELKAALANQNSPTYATNATTAKNEAKIIYVVGTIWGTDLGNGKFADEAYYKSTNTTAAKWDWNLYVQSLDTAYMADLATKVAAGDTAAVDQNTKIKALGSARTTLSNIQKAQIELVIPSNTTILGVGADAKLIDGYFSVNATSNIIVRNLEFQAPIDLTPSYDTTKKEWNARFKAFSVVTGKQLWVDHCTFTDGSHLDTEKLTINGYPLPVMRHDGLLDIEDSSDYITVSYSVFKNHDKTNMVGGSGDGNGYKERDFNHLTFSNNIWDSSVQRAPRARFGQIHVYNNYYTGNTDDAVYPANYYIGMGAESRILSEANVFDMTGSKAEVSRVISNLNGYQFKDVGSWFNSVSASAELEAAAKVALDARYSSAQSAAASSKFTVAPYTNELGWTPPYSYTRGGSAADVRSHNLANAGAGKLFVTVGSSTRPMISDSQADTYSVANALAGSDSWAPQSINSLTPNAGRINPATLTADLVVDKNGTGGYTTIQAALNAAAVMTGKTSVNIQVKAGSYNEQLVVPGTSVTTAPAITLYSTESDASKVRIYSGLAQVSLAADYTALVGATYDTSVYSGNNDGKTVFNACYRKTGAIGKECSTTIRVRNNGFTMVNMTVENTWGDTDASNNQALAVMVEKVDKVVFDNVRLISNQDTLYLSNSGKRTYFVGGEITGDVDFMFGPGVAVFDGATIRYTGARKPAGGYLAAPSTLNTQTYGFIFNNCVFLADSATADNSVFLSRQWDDSATSVGKMIVRNSVLGKHIALTTGPWNATTVSGAATVYSSAGEPYLGEYHNWQHAALAASDGSTPAPTVAPTPTPVPTATPTATPTSVPTTTPVSTSTDTPIAGSSTLANSFVSGGLPSTVGTVYDSVAGKYTLTSAGVMGGAADTLQFAYKAVTGDFTMVARLTSLDAVPTGLSTGNWRAGLMVRNSLDSGSRYFGLIMRGIPRLQWEQRKNDNETTSSSAMSPSYTASPSVTSPLWIKLARTGTSITISYSTDGVTWVGSRTQDFTASGYTALGSQVYVGLMGVSGTATVTSTSVFDNVTITTP